VTYNARAKNIFINKFSNLLIFRRQTAVKGRRNSGKKPATRRGDGRKALPLRNSLLSASISYRAPGAGLLAAFLGLFLRVFGERRLVVGRYDQRGDGARSCGCRRFRQQLKSPDRSTSRPETLSTLGNAI